MFKRAIQRCAYRLLFLPTYQYCTLVLFCCAAGMRAVRVLHAGLSIRVWVCSIRFSLHFSLLSPLSICYFTTRPDPRHPTHGPCDTLRHHAPSAYHLAAMCNDSWIPISGEIFSVSMWFEKWKMSWICFFVCTLLNACAHDEKHNFSSISNGETAES